MEQTLKISDFTRDLTKDSTGEDVKKIQDFLRLMQFEIDQKELDEKRCGESTQRAARLFLEQQKDATEKNPLKALFAKILFQIVFHIDPEELDPALNRGESTPVDHYIEPDNTQLQGLEAGTFGAPGSASRITNLAKKFIGVREEGDNAGPAVRMFCDGTEGEPWCGGFVHYVMGKAISPALYDQADFMSARSFEREAQAHGVFRDKSAYAPKPGDVVVFTRGGGKGHVGIVSDVATDGTVTYIAGNDSDAVRERTFNVNSPPQSLLGYSDTQALAAAKGIAINPDVAPSYVSSSVRIAKHSDAAIRLG